MALPGENIQDLNRADKAWELLQPWGLTPDNAVLYVYAALSTLDGVDETLVTLGRHIPPAALVTM